MDNSGVETPKWPFRRLSVPSLKAKETNFVVPVPVFYSAAVSVWSVGLAA